MAESRPYRLDSRGCFAKAPRFLQGTIEAQNPGFCFELLFRRGPSMNLFTSLVHFLRLTPSCKATTESGRKSTTSNSAQLNMQSGVAQDVVVEVDPIARPGTCPLCKSRPTTTCKMLCTDRTTIVRRVFFCSDVQNTNPKRTLFSLQHWHSGQR
jgi:hypothetical protein